MSQGRGVEPVRAPADHSWTEFFPATALGVLGYKAREFSVAKGFITSACICMVSEMNNLYDSQ